MQSSGSIAAAGARDAGAEPATERRLAPASWRQLPSPHDTMIAFLRGRVLEKHPNRIIVDVAGVGYDVSVPLSTFYGLATPGVEIALRIHTHVREDHARALRLCHAARASECSSA